MRLKLLFTAGALGAAYLLWQSSGKSRTVDFMADIKPILNKKCMACHGGVKQSGAFSLLTREEALKPAKSGKVAIVPGKAADSELMRRLRSHDPEERMPYKEAALSEAEITLFERWIDEGAHWGDHWAYLAVQKPALPKRNTLWGGLFSDKNTKGWGRNEIDAFVLDRLRRENLQPAPEAERERLLRRVCLDLTGLPPSPEQRIQFLADTLPNAYERWVDTLLSSPHYGERWAAVWLDLARYADSKGYERDAGRLAWRYRDWLIRAFNADMPYDRFITEQLAGDLLPNPDDAQLIATTFHRNTPTNDEGGTDNEEFRVAAVLDRVNTTWEALMGSTFACVQCHSHPYDPFFHEEYYQFAAFFNNTRDADTYDDYPLLRLYSGEDSLKYLRLKDWLAANVSPLEADRALQLARLWQPVWYSIECDSMVNADLLDTKWLGMSHLSSARLKNVPLDGVSRLYARLQTKMPGGSVTIRLDRPDGPVLTVMNLGDTKHELVIKQFDFQPVGGVHDLHFFYENAKLKKLPEAFGMMFDWFAFTAPFPGKGKTGFAEAEKDFFSLLSAGCETVPVMWENPSGMQRATRVFERGNWMTQAAAVRPGTPRYLPAFGDGRPANRLGLAQWLTDKNHPLTARVIANRLWEQVFGLGLVETAEDFGTQGAAPLHPELLDWLAWRLMHDHNWSVKQLLRDIVCSATYRQTSEVGPERAAQDPDNRFLARGPRVRLSAEQIRDQALTVSGLLNTKMYGKPVMPYQPDGIWQTPWNGARWTLSKGDEQYRRAVYTYWKRSSPYPSMMTFDGAGRQVCAARRLRTNTPLQALVTLNDPVFLECAKHLGLRMQREGGASVADQIRFGYLLATGRSIRPEKLAVLEQLYGQSLSAFQQKTDDAVALLNDLACALQSPETAAMAVVGNALLNLDEVVAKG